MAVTPNDAISRINWRIDEFCHAHGVGRSFVYEEIKRGELRVIKAGRRTLIPNGEAQEWQARRLKAMRRA